MRARPALIERGAFFVAELIVGSYCVLINLIGAGTVLVDKSRAKRGAWRVRERTFFIYCIIGGCPGVYFAMRAIRHKTLHKRFMRGIPAIFAVQIACAFFVYYQFGQVLL